MDSLNKDRDLYINNRLLLAEKCKVIDYKINTSLDERRNSQLKQKIDYENMIFWFFLYFIIFIVFNYN